MKPGNVAPIPRLALSRREAAAALGVSLEYFRVHIAPELRAVRRGANVLYAVTEIQAWLDRHSELTLNGRTAA